MAHTDHVTGLEPRGELEAFLARHDAATPLAMVMCDVVGLKEINERDGFLAGDACLRRAADSLRAAAPDAAIRARLGGDELVAIFTGPAAATAANHVAAGLTATPEPRLRTAATVRQPGESNGAFIERLYATVRRS